MRSVLERAPLSPEKDPFGLEGIQDDITHFRRYSSWSDLQPGMPEQRGRHLTLQYLKELKEQSQAMVLAARDQGRSAESIFLMKTLYGAEMTRVWSMRAETHREREFDPIFLQMVEWQHRVSSYLLDASGRKDLIAKPEREALRRFWASFKEIYSSAVPEADRKKQMEVMAGALRTGILRPVAIGNALRKQNGWEIYLPEDPEDDAHLKVDLVAESVGPQPQTYLLQLKPPDTPGQNLEVEPVRLGEEQYTPEMASYASGFTRYINKYHLDPAQTTGAVVRVSSRRFDSLTGLPDQDLEAAVERDFVLLDNQARGK